MQDPFAAQPPADDEEGRDFDPAIETHVGIVLGIGSVAIEVPTGRTIS